MRLTVMTIAVRQRIDQACHGHEAARVLEPVLPNLIGLGLSHRFKQEIPEQGPESDYVLF